MKDRFSEFYDKPDFQNLWKDCIFIFDTNIFINLYSSSKEDYDEFINVLKQISNRLWMPYQIGWEYQKNRHLGINKALNNHNSLNGLINDIKNPLNNIRNAVKNVTELQIDFVNKDSINKSLDKIDLNIKEIITEIESKPNFEDKIRDCLDSLYKGKVGAEYSTSRLKEICDEAEYRYECKIPPGFKDRKKTSGNPFGDFIIWNQIIDFAKDKNKSIIFITEDGKEDWWLNGEPHPFLIKEFSLTGQNFYMYKFSDFLIEAKKYLNANIKRQTIDKVKKNEKYHYLLNLLKQIEEPDEENKKLRELFSQSKIDDKLKNILIIDYISKIKEKGTIDNYKSDTLTNLLNLYIISNDQIAPYDNSLRKYWDEIYNKNDEPKTESKRNRDINDDSEK